MDSCIYVTLHCSYYYYSYCYIQPVYTQLQLFLGDIDLQSYKASLLYVYVMSDQAPKEVLFMCIKMEERINVYENLPCLGKGDTISVIRLLHFSHSKLVTMRLLLLWSYKTF